MSRAYRQTDAPLPDPATWAAFLRREVAGREGVRIGVTSTGIFCRLDCPARKPRHANCRVFAGAGAAEAAGFRACKRCRPDGPTGP